jgi:hypothetical protein
VREGHKKRAAPQDRPRISLHLRNNGTEANKEGNNASDASEAYSFARYQDFAEGKPGFDGLVDFGFLNHESTPFSPG